MATALALGFTGEWMAEHDAETLELAIRNCPYVRLALRSVFAVDPVDLP